MIVLALDLGSTTGWACSTGQAGVVPFAEKIKRSPAERHGRLGFRFSGWLGDLLVETGAAVVAVEEMTGRPMGEAGRVLFGLRMMALSCCWAHERLVEEVNASTWKPWARANLPDWRKGDLADARAILAYFQAERLPKLEIG